MKERSISLSRELDLIRSAATAARLLAERLLEMPSSNAWSSPELPWSLVAALRLVELRLGDVERVNSGHLDPEALYCEANAAVGEPEGDDVVLGWTEKRRYGSLVT